MRKSVNGKGGMHMKTYQIQKAVRLWIPLQHRSFPLQKRDGKV